MYFVHINPEDIKKRPWIGVLIGLFGMALFTFLSYNALNDYINYSKQQTPERINVEKIKLDPPTTPKWVTITNLRLKCELVEKINRTEPLDRLILGPVYNTYSIITDESNKDLVIIRFPGDAFCPDFQNKSLTGVLTTTRDLRYGLVITKLSDRASLIFYVDEGLDDFRNLLVISTIANIGLLYIFVSSSKKWLEKSESDFFK